MPPRFSLRASCWPRSGFRAGLRSDRAISCGLPPFRATLKLLPHAANYSNNGKATDNPWESQQKESQQNPKQPTPLPAIYKILLLGTVPIAVYIIDEQCLASVLQRSVRAVYALSVVAYNYYHIDNFRSLDELHDESAELLFSMIRKNKGLYIKLGQAIANQGALFPLAYQKRFHILYDEAPEDKWEKVDASLRRKLGPDYESEIFAWFDHIPVASASIAQVHKAQLKSGQIVAVKVQHPYIPKQIHADLVVYRVMSKVYSKVFDLPLSFSTAYVSEQLLKEADFRHEAGNAQRLAHFIEEDSTARNLNIYIPTSFTELCSSTILVSEWIDGIPLTDRQRLIDSGFDLKRLMFQYITIFGQQMFKYGFVHSDPHPGNIMAHRQGKIQQLVILDHGLYVELPTKFKDEYCALWKNILGYDSQLLKDLSEEWGIGSPELLKAIVQMKPPSNIEPESAPSSSELLRLFFGKEDKFPPDLIFLLRTMRMMQNLNKEMGSPVNRINLLAKSSLDAPSKIPMTWFSYIIVRVSLWVSDVVFWYFRLKQTLSGDKFGDNHGGLEDYIERYMRENAKLMGIDISEYV